VSLLFCDESEKGEKGLEPRVILRRPALLTRAFSSRSALKMKSRGDSCCVSDVEIKAAGGVGESSLLEEESLLLNIIVSLVLGESRTDLEKVGIGRADGAGEA
jgi:hypothetical protein